MNLKERVESLKKEIIQALTGQELVGKPIFVEDIINFPTKLIILNQNGTGIEVENEMGEVSEMDLRDFGIETLLKLIE